MTVGDKIKGFTRQQLADACYTGARICDATGCDSQIEPLLSAAAQLIADGEAVEACCVDVCDLCRDSKSDGTITHPATRTSDYPSWFHWCDLKDDIADGRYFACKASAIRERRYREQETKP